MGTEPCATCSLCGWTGDHVLSISCQVFWAGAGWVRNYHVLIVIEPRGTMTEQPGWSLADLAGRVHYTKGYLSKIENGVKPAGRDLARQCDAALGAGGALAALRPDRTAEPVLAGADPPDSDEVWMIILAPDGSSRFVPMSRRQALAVGAMSLLGLRSAARGLPAAADEKTTLTRFRSLFEQSRQLGLTVSPSVVVPSVIAQTQTLRAVAGAAREPAREQLLRLAGRCAEYTGWMAQEAGDDHAAAWWTNTAVRLAAGGGDSELAVYALVRQADLRLHQEDGIQTIALAERAQQDRRVPARIRGLAAQREAQGHALAGEYDRCRRALDRAEDLLSQAANEDRTGPVLGSTSVSNGGALVTAWCLHDLGRPGEAAELLDREVPRIPASARRPAARFGARQALAHAAMGNIERACAVTDHVLDLAEQVDSATVRLDLRRLSRTLARWQRRPQVGEVRGRLARAVHCAEW